MKTVIKTWTRDPLACALLLSGLVSQIAYIFLVALELKLIGETVDNPSTHNLATLALVWVGTALTIAYYRFAADYAHSRCFTAASNAYSDKILNADAEMFTKWSSARLITIGEYTAKLTRLGVSTVNFLGKCINIVVLLYNIGKYGGTGIIVPIVIVYIIGAIGIELLYRVWAKIDREADRIKLSRNQELDDTVNGYAEIRSFGTVKMHSKSIHNKNSRILKLRYRRSWLLNVFIMIFGVLDLTAVVGTIIGSIHGLTEGTIAVSTVMTLVMYAMRLSEPLDSILNYMDCVSANLSMEKEYAEVMEYENRYHNGMLTLDRFDGQIKLSDVHFSYNHTDEVLKGINMVIPKGSKIGICGSSGSGKSTLLKLLNQFYHPTQGTITVDGVDLADISTESYHRYIGMVQQDNIMMSGSIWDNVTYGSSAVTELDVIEACKKANIYDFIMTLTDRFNTDIGPRGIILSGGQKQRIALARIFLHNPDIIFLDEATSALDNVSEDLVKDALAMFRDKTIVTVAHRLTTIKDSDMIYVFNAEHEIAESGTHDELIEQNGIYATLYRG